MIDVNENYCKLFKFLKQFSMLSIRKMRQNYKNKDLLRNQPFYSSEIESSKKTTKKLVIPSFYMNYNFFKKNLKNYLILNYQKSYHFHQK